MSDFQSTPFTIDNIPFGVISTADNPAPRCATALDHDVVDLSALERDGFFDLIQGFGESSIFSKVNIIYPLRRLLRFDYSSLLLMSCCSFTDPGIAALLERFCITSH